MKILLILIAIAPTLALGASGEATRYLMNEPASLMDIGLLRAQLFLNDLDRRLNDINYYEENPDLTVDSSIDYIFEDDKLLVEIIVAEPKRPRSMCILFSEQYINSIVARIGSWFTHYVYSRAGQPESLVSEIRDRFELSCKVFKDGDLVGSWRRELNDEEVIWEEQTND
ncbi:MAG: hypothetical protein WD078_15745 [Woeseia sp.]